MMYCLPSTMYVIGEPLCGAGLLPRALVIRPEHRATRMRRRRRDLRIAHDDECLGDHQADAGGPRLSGFRDVDALQRSVIANVVGRVAVRHLPRDVAAIEVDR